MKLVWIIIPLILFSVVGMSESFGETIQWSVQFGTNSSDSVGDITIDSLDNVYVAGSTNGDLFDTNAGESDIFIVKYDTDGNELWTKQFGGTSNDRIRDITIDSFDNFYVTSYINAKIGYDGFIVKYDTDGNELWTKQFGGTSNNDYSTTTIDSLDNVYIAGNTSENLFGTNEGESDVFVIKYDTDGNELWTKQFGSDSHDPVTDITIDSLDNVYVTGYTRADLFGTTAGIEDVFIVKYDADGNELWTKQFGSSMNDLGTGITIDSLDNVYVTGYTEGDLFGTNAGIQDVFIVKYESQIITSNFFENILKFFKTLFD